jgi:hypothetical protein
MSPEVLLACGMRGLSLDLDINAPTTDEDEDESG